MLRMQKWNSHHFNTTPGRLQCWKMPTKYTLYFHVNSHRPLNSTIRWATYKFCKTLLNCNYLQKISTRNCVNRDNLDLPVFRRKLPIFHWIINSFLLVLYRQNLTLWSLPLSWLKWISSSLERSFPLEGLRDSTSVKAAIRDWIKWVHDAQALPK